MASSSKSIEQLYQKKDLHQHILDRPGMYVGDNKKLLEEIWVYDDQNSRFIKRPIEYSPALLKIFDEVLVNALDHSIRDNTVNAIKINVDKETGMITVWNNGSGIPIVEHKEHLIYIPELIFGNLLTSTNYDDTQSRIVGGMNGLGSKLTNIYSTKFIVETVDSERSLKYKQEFSDNMYKKSKPKITKCSTKSFTQISFIPDWKRFDMTHLEDDTILMFKKRVYDCVACSDKNVTVYWNGEKLHGKTFLDYISFYFPQSDAKDVFYDKYEMKVGKNVYVWEVGVVPYTQFEQVSFVNGINTTQGGKHVDTIVYQIVNKLKNLLETKKKIKDVKPSVIKERFFLFLRSTISNPSFSSQTKEYLSTAPKDFGCKVEVSDKFVEKLYKSSITEEIVAMTKLKETLELAKQTDGKKRSIIRVPKLEDAIWAGTGKSNQCTLILTEGESAKTFAMWGRAVVGPEKFGCFALKGKGLNIRDATTQQLINNQEINNIKQILGLKQGKVYENTNDLRYGKLLILTDSDVDGSHIKALILNMFHYWWPSLLKLNFIQTMRTPIVKAFKGNVVKEFFTQQDYEQWEQDNKTGNWKIKYYKGLGTSKREDAKECFSRFSELQSEYVYKDENCDKAILLAFEKDKNAKNETIKYTDKRKEWLKEYDRKSFLDCTLKQVPIQDFIHKELIHFSNYDNLRSIPNMCDGLKPSQRKILYYCLKKKIYNNEIKVAQLSGYVSAETSYHHGEASLQGAIVGMAQDFVGSNNLNILLPDSNFGSRYEGGKDAASPRYIFTRLNPISNIVFNQHDLPLLNYQEEDGQFIEPEWYMPVIPMVLVNGCEGIGTGYSTYVPPHNPTDIIANIERLFEEKELLPLFPWWRGFKGEVSELETGSYISRGKYKRHSDTQISITELPIGVWVTPYKEFLESLVDDSSSKSSKSNRDPILKDVQNKTTDENNGINFIVEFKNKKILDNLIKTNTLEKELKLTKTFGTGNMYLFDSNYKLFKYDTANDILKDFYRIRLDFYGKRKNYLTNLYQEQLDLISSKVRFITEYLDGILDINKKNKSYVIDLLEKRSYKKVEGSYDYLVQLPMITLTLEKIQELESKKQELENTLVSLNNKTPKDLWKEDLVSLKLKLKA